MNQQEIQTSSDMVKLDDINGLGSSHPHGNPNVTGFKF